MTTHSFNSITPHIFRLDLALGPGATVAVFLVRDGDGWTLVDAGPEKHADLIMKAALDCTQGEKPRRLILTHGHPDHAGSALRLRTEWRLKVAAGRLEIPYLTEPVFYRKIPAHTPFYYLAMLLDQPQMLGKGVDLPLDEKQMIEGMTVYAAPGHAPGMVALLHHADRALLCADVFANRRGLGDPMPFLTYDPKLNRKSQAKLALLDFDHLLPSRGPVIMRSGKQAALAYVEKRLGKRALENMRPALAK